MGSEPEQERSTMVILTMTMGSTSAADKSDNTESKGEEMRETRLAKKKWAGKVIKREPKYLKAFKFQRQFLEITLFESKHLKTIFRGLSLKACSIFYK